MVIAKVISLLVLLVLDILDGDLGKSRSAGRAYVVFGRSSFTSASDILSMVKITLSWGPPTPLLAEPMQDKFT
ncbi:MAG: hypothetical protein IRD7MM_01595 [Candidatus Midichloria mitochondrii]